MTARAITPTWIAAGAAAELAAWWVMRRLTPDPVSYAQGEVIILGFFSALAYLLALALCLQISNEYEKRSWMRLGWLALGAMAAISAARYLFDNSLPHRFWPELATPPVLGVTREVFLVAEFLCLLAGVVAIWMAFHALGLGLRLLKRDQLLMLVTLVMMGVLIYERDSLSEHQSNSPLAVGLQLASHIILVLAAVCSVPLHRLCVQMGGGRMAHFMRMITAYALLRSGAIFVGMIVLGNGGGGWLGLAATLAWRSTPWVFALAAVVRYGMVAAVEREAARHVLSHVPTH